MRQAMRLLGAHARRGRQTTEGMQGRKRLTASPSRNVLRATKEARSLEKMDATEARGGEASAGVEIGRVVMIVGWDTRAQIDPEADSGKTKGVELRRALFCSGTSFARPEVV